MKNRAVPLTLGIALILVDCMQTFLVIVVTGTQSAFEQACVSMFSSILLAVFVILWCLCSVMSAAGAFHFEIQYR